MKYKINGKIYRDPVIVKYLEYKTKEKALHIPDTDEDCEFMKEHPVILINTKTSGQLALTREETKDEKLMFKVITERFLLKEDSVDIKTEKDLICKLYELIQDGDIILYAAMYFEYRGAEKVVEMMANVVDGVDNVCDYNEYPEFWKCELLYDSEIVNRIIALIEGTTFCEEM